MVDFTPGNSGANKGYWMVQLRDRFGKFVEMGGDVIIEIELPGVKGPVRAVGKFIGMYDLQRARIEVSDDREVPRGVYIVETSKISSAKAVLPSKYVEEKIAEVKGQPAPKLRKAISGDEALKIRMKSVAKVLKEKGRFPVPRIGALGEAGKDTDIANGARLDYQKVFDSSPEVQEKFKTFENMWDYVSRNGTDLTTQSPNDLSQIPAEMKLLNRAYAEHVLEMDPDGLLTVYRNAVNGKDTESESAVGYVSLDRQMAWDYNSTRENIGANGRYEIDVKPDEVQGLLGYSRVEDEYGLAIGRGVTEQPGRVRRIGDLEPAKLAPWLEDWNNSFVRQRGMSPLRGFNIAGEYDFHEVEDFGENIQEFFAKYGLQASDVAAMFDKLYGEGAYARYKESGNTVSFQLIKKMFTKLENGNIGVNAEYLNSFNTLKPNSEYKDDQFDNIMKMLSVFQELTGQPFMTHKTRDYTPPPKPNKDSPDSVVEDVAPDGSSVGPSPSESEATGVIPPGYQNWMPAMADILGFNDDEDSEEEANPALGNELLSKTLEKAGYNEKPQVVSTEEFNSIEGETIYRAVVDEAYVDQYLNSPDHFAGTGVFGNGTYSTNKRESAEAYAGSTDGDPDVINSRMLEMKLSPDANVLYFKSKSELREWATANANKFKEQYKKFGANPGELHEFDWQINSASDWTNLAVMAGYDAVRFPPDIGNEHFTIILNRGKVIVNGKS